MPNRISASFQLFLRRILRKFEIFFFLAKEILSERNFIYLSCVAVAISCALAVILLKTFAHNVFLWANYINNYLKLPYSNSILPIIGILLTVFVIKRFLGGSIEKGSSKILYSVAKKGVAKSAYPLAIKTFNKGFLAITSVNLSLTLRY